MRTPDQIFEELLVIESQNGDQKAFALLVKRWDRRVKNHLLWKTGEKRVVEDLSQECWLSASRGIANLKDPSRFASWILRVANNKAVDWVRKTAKNRCHFNEFSNEEQDFENHPDPSDELLMKLRKGMAGMDPDKRLLLKMHYLDEMKVDEIGHVMKLPVGTVKSRLFKARKKLKDIILNQRNHG